MSGSLDACDWSTLDYYEVFRTVSERDLFSEEEFFSGPFRRFLEIGGDQETHVRVRARGMEHAREALRFFCDRQQSKSGSGNATAARAHMIAAAWFSGKPDGDYMVEVLHGTGTHNYRGEAHSGGGES